MAQSLEEPRWSQVGAEPPGAPGEDEVLPAPSRSAPPPRPPRVAEASLDDRWADLRASGLACDRW